MEDCVKKVSKTLCCTNDGGRPFGVALQEETPNCYELLRSKGVVVNVMVKGAARLRHVRTRKANASEPSTKHR